jgi:hypothetical protein
MIKLRSHPM